MPAIGIAAWGLWEWLIVGSSVVGAGAMVYDAASGDDKPKEEKKILGINKNIVILILVAAMVLLLLKSKGGH